MSKGNKLKGAITAAALLTPIAALANPERWQLNMTKGVTEVSREVHDLHMFMFYVCCVIGAIVFGAMFYSMWKFRKSKGAVAAKFSHNTTAEVIWTVVPIIILVVMAVPATRVLLKMYDTSEAEMTVKITGYQWKWRYEYVSYREDANPGINFISSLTRQDDEMRRVGSGQDPVALNNQNYLLDVDKPLVLPADTKIRFVITADDVIHAWWVPVLGWKQDAIPGFINEAWTRIDEPGTYRGQCAELCGKDHGFMPIVVNVLERDAFERWLAEQKAAAQPAADAAAVADANSAAVAAYKI
jgi:cytochrome c oxidase subunit 2